MFWWTEARTREWLESRGVVASGDDAWSSPWSDHPVTDDELAHHLAWAPEDPDLGSEDRLMWFGLLDLLDNYAAAMYLAWEFTGADAEFAGRLDLVWDFCREVLERTEETSGVPYWLWVDWFEDPATSALAFTSVVGAVSSSPGDLRRVDRVVRVSGPVAWPAKIPIYYQALAFPQLHDAVLEGLMGSVRDVYGQVDVDSPVSLLSRLNVSGDGAELAAQLKSELGSRPRSSRL